MIISKVYNGNYKVGAFQLITSVRLLLYNYHILPYLLSFSLAHSHSHNRTCVGSPMADN